MNVIENELKLRNYEKTDVIGRYFLQFILPLNKKKKYELSGKAGTTTTLLHKVSSFKVKISKLTLYKLDISEWPSPEHVRGSVYLLKASTRTRKPRNNQM